MATLNLWTHIKAPPERVWDVISDIPGQRRWMVDLRKVEPSEAQGSTGAAAWAGEGAVLDVTSELFGLPLVKDRMRISRWEPPTRFDVEHIGAFTGTGEFILKPVAGGTLFSWREVFKPPLGVLGELGFALVVGPHLRSVFRRSMANVKRLSEGREGASKATTND
jgi:uncharacterized protein YndB with AHSA1/START domain